MISPVTSRAATTLRSTRKARPCAAGALACSPGRFDNPDAFEGPSSEPASLHKYAFAAADPVQNIDPSGLFSVAELGSVSGIQNIILSGVNLVGKIVKAYNTARRFVELLDSARTIIRFARAIGQAPSVEGAAVALAAELRQAYGVDNANDITRAFGEMAESVGPHWNQIAHRITESSRRIAEDVALAIALQMPRYIAAEAARTLQFILFAPTGPGDGGRRGDNVITFTDRFAVGVAPTGGRLFGFGVRTSRARNAGYDQWFRIDYYDRTSRPPLHVHYHVFGDERAHPENRTIWRL